MFKAHFVCLIFASTLVPSSAYINALPFFSRLKSPGFVAAHRASRVCKCVSVVAISKNPKSKLVASDKIDENAPEGGWAPPPWKRKITNPLKDLVAGQGPIQGTVRNVEVNRRHWPSLVHIFWSLNQFFL